MNSFASGVIADLRAKRMWPVVLLLLAALVALPFVAVKKEETPEVVTAEPAATAAANTVVADQRPLVTLADLESTSKLDVFTAKNPFKPMPDVRADDSEVVGGGAPESVPSQLASKLPSGPAAGGSRPGGGGGSPGPPATLPGPPADQPESSSESKEYTYLADLRFGTTSSVRRYRSFPRLGLLPSERTPLIVFLGVTSGGNHAVFLVDSTLSPTGEGTCRPSRRDCGVLYLEPGELEHLRTASGDAYALQVDQIRKVSLEEARRAQRRRRARQSSAAAPSEPGRRLALPFLSDLEASQPDEGGD